MKNYKKIYEKLIKTLKEELVDSKEYITRLDNRRDLVQKIEIEGKIDFLKWLFVDFIPEIEGKKCNMVTMNREEFKDWKKEIKL